MTITPPTPTGARARLSAAAIFVLPVAVGLAATSATAERATINLDGVALTLDRVEAFETEPDLWSCGYLPTGHAQVG